MVIVASYQDSPSLHAINVRMAFEFFATEFKGHPYIYCKQGREPGYQATVIVSLLNGCSGVYF